MKISIITATYNSPQNIDSALESINSQKNKNLELVIIDGPCMCNIVSIFFTGNLKIISKKENDIKDALKRNCCNNLRYNMLCMKN